jgi:hypothetical protein
VGGRIFGEQEIVKGMLLDWTSKNTAIRRE